MGKVEQQKNEIQVELKNSQDDYTAAKQQSMLLDDLLGYECQEIEDNLYEFNNGLESSKPRQFWYGLDLQSLQTPYSEIVEMIDYVDPKPGDTWLDLGAAYGRIGVVLGFLRPRVKFIGYEYVEERAQEGQRIFDKWSLVLSKMKKVDLGSQGFQMGKADLYFLYDFGSKKDVYDALEKLRVVASERPIRVIARGRGVRNWIPMDFPWLGSLRSPIHFSTWSLFQS